MSHRLRARPSIAALRACLSGRGWRGGLHAAAAHARRSRAPRDDRQLASGGRHRRPGRGGHRTAAAARARSKAREQIQIAAWTFWRGRIAGKTVVVSRTEVGPVNASTATTLAIVNFRPRLIINQGTAGAAMPDLEAVRHRGGGGDRSTTGRSDRRTAGAGAGVDLSRWTPMPHRLRLDGGRT
ncbi:MAG: hypothetical protein MZW92_40405 [Comamonadaceae bacterium]|nr:hypothetical protein [Comamonadaceae bacterium]